MCLFKLIYSLLMFLLVCVVTITVFLNIINDIDNVWICYGYLPTLFSLFFTPVHMLYMLIKCKSITLLINSLNELSVMFPGVINKCLYFQLFNISFIVLPYAFFIYDYIILGLFKLKPHEIVIYKDLVEKIIFYGYLLFYHTNMFVLTVFIIYIINLLITSVYKKVNLIQNLTPNMQQKAMKQVLKIHNILCDISELFNEIFSLSIVLFLGQIFCYGLVETAEMTLPNIAVPLPWDYIVLLCILLCSFLSLIILGSLVESSVSMSDDKMRKRIVGYLG